MNTLMLHCLECHISGKHTSALQFNTTDQCCYRVKGTTVLQESEKKKTALKNSSLTTYSINTDQYIFFFYHYVNIKKLSRSLLIYSCNHSTFLIKCFGQSLILHFSPHHKNTFLTHFDWCYSTSQTQCFWVLLEHRCQTKYGSPPHFIQATQIYLN